MSKPLATTDPTALISTALDADDRKVVKKCIAEIRKTKASIVCDVLKMGEHLFNVRDTLDKYGSKAFGQFLNSDDVQVSRRRAEEYMHAYESFADMPAELTGLFTAKAIYQLSAPSAPADAPDAAIEKAKGGLRITEKAAKELVQELAVEPGEPDPEPVDPWNEPHEPEPGGSDPAEHAKPPAEAPTRGPIGNTKEHLGAERQDGTRVSEPDGNPDEGVNQRTEPDTPDEPFQGKPEKPDQMDGAGHVVTGKVAGVFADVDADWDRMLGCLRSTQMICDDLRAKKAGESLERVGVENDIKRMAQKMEQLRPYSACPKCSGEGCFQCSERGWVSQIAYMQSYTTAEREWLAEQLNPAT